MSKICVNHGLLNSIRRKYIYPIFARNTCMYMRFEHYVRIIFTYLYSCQPISLKDFCIIHECRHTVITEICIWTIGLKKVIIILTIGAFKYPQLFWFTFPFFSRWQQLYFFFRFNTQWIQTNQFYMFTFSNEVQVINFQFNIVNYYNLIVFFGQLFIFLRIYHPYFNFVL